MEILIDGPDQIIYQWDTGQRLRLHGYEPGTRVDFARCNQNKAASVYAYAEGGEVFCDIPDAILMEPNHIRGFVYVIDGGRGETVRNFLLPVIPRPKPEDYVEPEEVPTWHELEQRIKKIEDEGVPDEKIERAVEDYLEENPIEAPKPDLTGVVKSVNGKTPDENGNVEITIPDSSQNVNPVEKTEDMTQPVGVDENGRLWTAPSEDKAEIISLTGWTYGYIGADGEHIAGGAGACTSNYVRISAGNTYKIVYPSSVTEVRFAIYDSDKNFVSRIIDGTAVYAAESDGYLRITATAGSTNAADYADVYLSESKTPGNNTVTDEQIAKAVADYMAENPVSGGVGADYSFLKGLKYYALGDSIVDMQGTLTAPETFGDTGYSKDLQDRDISGITVEGYVTAIERRYGLIATNFGKGGHTLVGDYSTLSSMDYSDVALVTIAYGVNDARTGVPLGTVNSTDGATFAGALNNILRKIYTDNPECRVLVLSPMQRLTVTDFGIATPNVNGNYLIDFVDMCRKVAEKRSTPFLDQYRCTGINQTNLYYYTVEGVHPVNQGFARIRNAVIGILDEQFALEYEPIGVMTNTGDTEPDAPETGGDSGGEEPPEEDAGATAVELTADMFTMDGLYIDGSGTIQQKTDSRSNASPIVLIPGKTYTLVTYLTNRYSDTKNYIGVLAGNADFPTTTGGDSLRTDQIGASFEDNAAMFGNVNHAKITYTWVADEGRKYLFVGTTKLSDDLMITLSYV